ncbi:hypothetical protein FO519_005659 [Halicephalobus sp. NKZ332]|nr:hypothetical protein FO519_005659 [Halicephalobus sp. NKZ332]
MSKAALVNEVMVNLGLKEGPQPASFWSLFFLYFALAADVFFILARIVTLLLMWRDWCRKGSEIRQTFFAFVAVYFLIDVPRIGLYSAPILFSYGSTKGTKTLMLIAGYYKTYWDLARCLCLSAISWNRFAVIIFDQRPAWNTQRSGPSVFLLILMPLLPTVVCSTIPQVYGNLVEDILLICRIVELLIVKSSEKKWTKTDTDQAVVTGIEAGYTLVIDTVSFIGLFIVRQVF